jgi:YgiT-type zinc finger domain-containing protein
MKPESMRANEEACPLCRSGHKQAGKTTFTVDLGFVVVRDAPARVCDLCGTDWISDKTAEALQHIIEQAQHKHPVVEVANWSDEVKAFT